MSLSSSMQQQIQAAASVLAGKSVWRCTRAADMACFQFGQRRQVKNVRGNDLEVGEYALRLQCPWRIVKDDQVVVAALDVYHPRPGHEDEDGPEFDWEHAGNLFDERIVTFFENDTREYVVEKVLAGHAGALRLLLQAEFWLEVCPCDSRQGEHWRLFEPRSARDHFVVTGAGIGEPVE
jgi:hypothetical protein